MENSIKKILLKPAILLFSLLMSIQVFAQDKLDIDVDLGGNDAPSLFTKPVFWVGVAVVLIILALIMKGKK